MSGWEVKTKLECLSLHCLHFAVSSFCYSFSEEGKNKMKTECCSHHASTPIKRQNSKSFTDTSHSTLLFVD